MPGRLLTERPIWSPDGRALLFTTGGRRIHVLDLIDGSVRFLAYGHDPVWSPDGRQIALVRLGRAWDLATVRADGTAATGVAQVAGGIRSPLLWDAVGGSLCFADAQGRVTSVRVPDGKPVPLDLPFAVDALSISPDGDWLAFTAPCEDAEGLRLHLYHRRDGDLRAVGDVPPCRLHWTRKGRALIALAEVPGGRCIRYDMATATVLPLRVPEGLVPLAPSPTRDDTLYSEIRAPGDLTVGETGGNRLRVFAHGHLPAWSPDGDSVAFYDSPDEEGSLCTQGRDGSNFVRWPGTSPNPPLRERASDLGAWSVVLAIFPGLPGAGAALATAPFVQFARPWHAPALLAGWLVLFSLYRPLLHWAIRVGHTFECPCVGQALAALPAAALAALSLHRAFSLHALWAVPLVTAWLALCVFGATALTRRKPGSYRAIAAAWAMALAATTLAGTLHSRRQATEAAAGPPPRDVVIRAVREPR